MDEIIFRPKNAHSASIKSHAANFYKKHQFFNKVAKISKGGKFFN
jgi:hypothetical protein